MLNSGNRKRSDWALHQSIRGRRRETVMLVGRRAFMLGIAASVVNGCAGGQDGDSPMLAALKMLWNGTTPIPVDRAYVAALPYASMLARLNDGPWALLILASGLTEGHGWFSAEQQMLATQGPWVVRTVGLDINLDRTYFADINPFSTNLATLPSNTVISRRVDARSMGQFDLVVNSTYENHGNETVEILDISLTVDRIIEHSTYPALDITLENIYLVDRVTGFCWQSEQLPLPGMAKIFYSIAKPPAT
jgi:hypothetical protein